MPASRVIVLGTLHQFHTEFQFYDFAVLRQVLLALAPDVLFVELSHEDLVSRAAQQIKREYGEAVFPVIDKLNVETIPLEPSGLEREQILDRMARAEGQVAPEAKAAITAGVQEWFERLALSWHSAADVNSSLTDASVREKHATYDRMYPAEYARVWDTWNEIFLSKILEATEANTLGQAVVVVGLEHCYWLRDRLRDNLQVELVDAERVLRGLRF